MIYDGIVGFFVEITLIIILLIDKIENILKDKF